MKRFIPALFAALVLSAGAQAQSITVGPGGVQVDPRSPRERAMDREFRHEERARDRQREDERYWRARDRRSDCRTVVSREETPRGTIRRETRICD